MLKFNNRSKQKLIKGAVIFIATALVFQVFLSGFMTPEGAAGIYPYYLALKTEKINTMDLGVGEYYPLKDVAENSDLIILAVDDCVAVKRYACHESGIGLIDVYVLCSA